MCVLRSSQLPMIERELNEVAKCGKHQRKSEGGTSSGKPPDVFRRGPIPISLGTVEGRLLEVNERYAELFGYVPEEMIGKTVQELNLWAVPAERDEILEKLLHDGRTRALAFLHDPPSIPTLEQIVLPLFPSGMVYGVPLGIGL